MAGMVSDGADEATTAWARGLEQELLLLSRHMTVVTAVEEGWQLDRSAYLLLSRLENGGPLSIKGLAASLGLDVSTVNRQTGSLLRKGLVERILDPAGGIARKLNPTSEGLRLLHSDRTMRLVAINRLVADWDLADQESLVAVLRRLNERMEERLGISWPREGPE
jgi:DNA-binding MarR family transcriptional regulator